MASLTLKNLPEGLLRALRDAADRERRSLNQEVLHLLELALRASRRAGPPSQARAQLAAWRKLAGRWESDVDARTEMRRIAQARSSGREVDL